MPARALLGTAVVAAWCGTMAWRVERDCLPRWREAAKASYRSGLAGQLPFAERFRIIASGRPLGTLRTSGDRLNDGSIGLLETVEIDGKALQASWPFLEQVAAGRLDGPLRFRLSLNVSPEYRLKGFELDGTVAGLPVNGSGAMSPEGMKVFLSIGGMREGSSQRMTVPIDPDLPVLMGFSAFSAVPDLAVGRRWEIRVLNPLSLRPETLVAEVEGTERFRIAGRDVEVRRIVIRHAMGEMRAWIDPKGRPLRQEAFGVVLERVEDAE